MINKYCRYCTIGELFNNPDILIGTLYQIVESEKCEHTHHEMCEIDEFIMYTLLKSDTEKGLSK